jgi:flagellar biosynthesis protein FlhF
MTSTKTYRGRTVAELLPQIRAEFGDDAVIVSQREGLTGGLGGFFQKACVELDVAGPDGMAAAPAPSLIDVHDDEEPAMPPAPVAPTAAAPGADERLARFAQQLHSAPAQTGLGPAAPALRPTVHPQVSDLAPGEAPVRWPGDDDAAFVPTVFGDAPVAAAAVAAAVPAPPAMVDTTSAAWPAEAHARLDALADSGLGEALSAEVVTHALTDLAPFASAADGAPALAPLVTQALAQRIPVTTLHAVPGRTIAFVGPGGAGKTRCVAAIANAYATRSDLSCAVVTLRSKDDGAELRRVLGPAGVPVHGAADALEARDRIESLRSHCLVIVDTPAVSPRAHAEMRVLGRELAELELDEIHLTLPATTGAVAARELIAGTGPLGITALALTHVDETAALGPSIAIAVQTRLPLSFVSRGPFDAASLRPAVASELAAAVVS